MKVSVLYRNDPERPIKDPVLEPGGRKFVFRLVRGDYCDPFGGQWFGPDYPVRVIRWRFTWLAFPFVAFKWPFLDRAFYFGAKVYGADAPEYLDWMGDQDVGPDSVAFCISFRPFASMKG